MDCSSSGATTCNWTEEVEDLVHAGDIDQAISILESIVSGFEKEIEKEESQYSSENSCVSKADQLSVALQDLCKLYSTKGLYLRADQVLSRALQIKNRKGVLPILKEATSDHHSDSHESSNEVITPGGVVEDDWEAIADRAPEELLSPQCLPGVSELSLEDSKAEGAKRRGRGTFSYKKHGLYSDNQTDEPVIDDSDDSPCHVEGLEKRDFTYGTRHVLVLADFPASTRTTDLEKVLEKFKDRFLIRWMNDTTALAVFRTPSVALEAINSIRCPFTVRVLDERDELVSSIPLKDLEPPRQRPQTSARTAQRLIAHSMGIKLPSTFGATELRKQEEARKNRIVSRQNMRDDAWGADEN